MKVPLTTLRKARNTWIFISDVTTGIAAVAAAALIALLCAQLGTSCAPYQVLGLFLSEWVGIFFVIGTTLAVWARIIRINTEAEAETHAAALDYPFQAGRTNSMNLALIFSFLMVLNGAFGFTAYGYFTKAAFQLQNSCNASGGAAWWLAPQTTPWLEAWRYVQGRPPTLPVRR